MKSARSKPDKVKSAEADPPPVVLTIAGFDPTSGAGATADIKTIAAHGCYGVGAITALTVQSTAGVRRVEPISHAVLTETLVALAEDMELSAVHIGMLVSGEIAAAVADFIEIKRLRNVVLDPVFKSSSGKGLIDEDGVSVIRRRLFSLAKVITPNVDEAAVLTGLAVTNLNEMRIAAKKLHRMGAKAVVITGGHLEGPIDLLSILGKRGPQQKIFSGRKLRSSSTHGTGCAFATAIACQLALGQNLERAVPLAKAYVTEAIARAYPVGKGIGPINHLHSFRKTKVKNLKTR